MKLSVQAQGAIWKLFSAIFLVPINGIVHYLARASDTPLPAVEVAFFMDLVALICFLPVMHRIDCFKLTSKSFLAFCARGAFSALGLMLWFLALEKMPLAQVTALKYMSPFITLLGAWFFLHESMTPTKVGATLVAVIGALLIAEADLLDGHADLADVTMMALIPLGSVLALVASELLGKTLTNTEPSNKVTFYLFLFTVPFLAVNTVFVWQVPAFEQLQWIAVMGLLTAASNYCLNKAFGLVELSFLVPISFSRFVLSVLMGIVVFSEWPSAWVWGGSVFIIGATVFLMYTTLRQQPKLA